MNKTTVYHSSSHFDSMISYISSFSSSSYSYSDYFPSITAAYSPSPIGNPLLCSSSLLLSSPFLLTGLDGCRCFFSVLDIRLWYLYHSMGILHWCLLIHHRLSSIIWDISRWYPSLSFWYWSIPSNSTSEIMQDHCTLISMAWQ